MNNVAPFRIRGRNPDILTCIANLSNDEVFTPPDLANRMLDMVADAWAKANGGANIWANKSVRFLDPCTKSGVFLREITRRLVEGLAEEIPDLRSRVDHILTEQVFGIGVTRLTSLLARRSVYCSKNVTGEHSIVAGFTNDAGNVWFERVEHDWIGSTEWEYVKGATGKREKRYTNGKCIICGAPRSLFDRNREMENHAYAFIHPDAWKTRREKVFGGDMQFDVIIGNPPYQMTGGAGGSSDSSIYHLFVEQAIKLEPRFLSMVIPSRWMAGGRGLDHFRAMMLNGNHLRRIVDYPDSREAFPGVQIKGGVCYFLWDKQHASTCRVTRVADGSEHTQPARRLGEYDVFVRDERALSILKKVLTKDEPSILTLISGDTPFGIPTNYEGWSQKSGKDKITLHLINKGKRIAGFMPREGIHKNATLVDEWKVLVPKAYGAGESYPHQILGKPLISGPPSACTQSYLYVGPFRSERAATSFYSYYHTRFFRFLVSLRKITQDALRSTYSWVPQQSWSRVWTDDLLYEKYGITKTEKEFIESLIRPMGDDDE